MLAGPTTQTKSDVYTAASPVQVTLTRVCFLYLVLDDLASARYGKGLANDNPIWSYDAAGNRNDTVADTLNRPITIGGVACQSDMNGNRKQFGSIQYSWDQLNRLHQYNNSTTYTYRADGMRVYKTNSSGSTCYRYDGQMGMEDIDYAANGSVSKVTDYGIGARGIDAMYVTQSGSTTAVYPLYDAHSNMISTLARYGTAGYTTSTYRTFDAWGNIRVGTQTGDPKGRYCANLGHKQDDESGLLYMRARYYEPVSGRFLTEDPSRRDSNTFSYAQDNPTRYTDQTGKAPLDPSWQMINLWLFDIEALCKSCADAQVIFMANFIIWAKNAALSPTLNKDYFISEAEPAIFDTTPNPATNPEQMALDVGQAYAVSLEIDMWLILGDAPTGIPGS